MNWKDDKVAAGDVEGLYLSELSPGDVLLIETLNSTYSLVYLGASAALLAKHSPQSTEPASVNILGSTWGDSMLKMGFLGVSMCIEFERSEDGRVVVTSPIQSLQRSPARSSTRRLDGDAHGRA